MEFFACVGVLNFYRQFPTTINDNNYILFIFRRTLCPGVAFTTAKMPTPTPHPRTRAWEEVWNEFPTINSPFTIWPKWPWNDAEECLHMDLVEQPNTYVILAIDFAFPNHLLSKSGLFWNFVQTLTDLVVWTSRITLWPHPTWWNCRLQTKTFLGWMRISRPSFCPSHRQMTLSRGAPPPLSLAPATCGRLVKTWPHLVYLWFLVSPEPLRSFYHSIPSKGMVIRQLEQSSRYCF